MLQAPDLLGVPSSLELAAIAPEVVKNALRLKKIGNAILSAIGGRSIHPVNACVGGFHRWPDVEAIESLLPDLEWGLETSKETVKWSMTLPYPELEVDYDFVAIHNPDEYGIIRGEVWSSKGSKLSVSEYETRYIEEQVKHSSAYHGLSRDGGSYIVGPLARLNLNHEQLLPQAKKALQDSGIQLPITNPYKSLIARAVELVQAYEEAIELVKGEDQEGAMALINGIETTICSDSSPCLDPGCSTKAAGAVRDVKALLSSYFTIRPKLLQGSRELVCLKGKEQDVEFSPEDVERVIAPLSNSWRLTILRILRQHECTMSEIGKALNMKTGHLQFHMRALKEAGYITSERRRRTYSITEKGEKAIHGLTALMASLS